MRNYQKNATMNHSAELESIGSAYYERQFNSGVIGKMRGNAIIECLAVGKNGTGGYLVPDTYEKKLVKALTEHTEKYPTGSIGAAEKGVIQVPQNSLF